MILLLTCPFGLSHVLTAECKRLGYSPYDTFPTGTYVTGDRAAVYHLNLRSRIANKVYVQVGQTQARDFDVYMQRCTQLPRKEWIDPQLPCRVTATVTGSSFRSETTAQSLTHKAISLFFGSPLAFHTDSEQRTGVQRKQQEDVDIDTTRQTDIRVYIVDQTINIWLNTSGPALYKRGYRTKTGPAMLKENIAAGLLLMSGRRFSDPFWDPCCGSGVLPIEAAMLARNQAPGLQRGFAYEHMPSYDEHVFDTLCEKAKGLLYQKSYTIVGSDIDTSMLTAAQTNAHNTGLSDILRWEKHDITTPLPADYANNEKKAFLAINPPYGKRLQPAGLDGLYHSLDGLFAAGHHGVVITSYPRQPRTSPTQTKVINNNSEKCTVYMWK